MPPSRIDRFTGDHEFLSNFYGHRNSVEHRFQAAKATTRAERDRILAASSPGEAKRLGQRVHLREDWEEVKLAIMLDLLREKFTDPWLRFVLLGTADAELIEGNDWHDTFWGRCFGEHCRSAPHPPEGQNHLGVLLIVVREECRPTAVGRPHRADGLRPRERS